MSLKIVIPLGLTLLAVFIGVDVYLAVDKLPGNTWSEILRSWGKATPIIPWCCSVLMGHFFHPIDNLKPLLAAPENFALLIWFALTLGVVGLGLARSNISIPPWTIVIPGLVAGSVLWPV